MPVTLQDELLAKAAHNAARLEEFFVAHRDWRAGPAGVASLQALRDALERALVGGLRPLLERHGVEEPRGGPDWCVTPLPPGELEPERVHRFGVFVQQLGDWFITLPEVQVSARGGELLAALACALSGTAAAVEQMLAAGGQVASPPAPPAPEPSPALPTPRPARMTDAARQARLVLEDAEATPVLQTFKGAVELTFDAQQALTRFLEEAGVTFDSYQRNNLDRKVLQWVRATPHGSVLVIRVGDLNGAPEPFPTYAVKK